MNFRLLLIAGTLGAMALTSCKTTEKNYQEAYSTAIQKKETSSDPAITKLIEEEKRGRETVINGDSVRVKVEYTSPVGNQTTTTPMCGIVVGKFKQIFNANSFKTRLVSKGYKDAYVLKDRDDTYFVIIQGFDSLEVAAAYLKNFKKNVPFAIPIKPYILRDARR